MNFFLISFFLVFVPLISQVVVGTTYRNKKDAFSLLSLLNVVLIVIFSYIGLKIIAYDANKQQINCGMPTAAFMFLCVMFMITLAVIIIAQLMIRFVRSKKTN